MVGDAAPPEALGTPPSSGADVVAVAMRAVRNGAFLLRMKLYEATKCEF